MCRASALGSADIQDPDMFSDYVIARPDVFEFTQESSVNSKYYAVTARTSLGVKVLRCVGISNTAHVALGARRNLQLLIVQYAVITFCVPIFLMS